LEIADQEGIDVLIEARRGMKELDTY